MSLEVAHFTISKRSFGEFNALTNQNLRDENHSIAVHRPKKHKDVLYSFFCGILVHLNSLHFRFIDWDSTYLDRVVCALKKI